MKEWVAEVMANEDGETVKRVGAGLRGAEGPWLEACVI